MSTKKLQIIGNFGGNSIEIDDTLTRIGHAADAKATGDAINQLQANVDNVANIVNNLDDTHYTESEIDSMMADLNATIDTKSDSNHIHDTLYYTETEIDAKLGAMQSDLDSKVDAVDGKGLSTNDYTDEEQQKLRDIESGANYYEHPAHSSHDSGLYKVTVDDEGHVSGATVVEKKDILAFVEKDDIVNLGFMDEDSVSSEISDLNDRIDGVEGDLNTTNETLNGLSEEFESYKTTNNEAVATNTSGIEANKTAIEEIQEDYLTSIDKTHLQDGISQVSEKATANATAIEILNGEGNGSVKQSIDNAFNEFAAKISDDKVVNTYKELIDYADEHGAQFTTLVGNVANISDRVGDIESDISDYKTTVSNQFAEIDTMIDNHINDTQEALQGKADSEHMHEIGHIDSLQDLLDELRTDIDTNAEDIDTKANLEHEHSDLYYNKDEIEELVTVEDIDDICGSNVIIGGGDANVVSYATKQWVQDGYQPKGNYLTSVPDGYATESYVDTKIAAIPTPDVSGQINTHNLATDAHNDIRLLVDGLTTRLNTLADCDDTTLDQMSEVVECIKSNQSLIEGITTKKVNVADIIDNLTTNVSNKPLSAAQGAVLKGLIEELTNNLSNYQPKGDYLTAVPAGYATEEFVTAKIAEAELGGEEVDLSGYAQKSEIPTKVSQLQNDSGYLTEHQSLEGLATEEWVEEKFDGHSGYVAQPDAPDDINVLWLDTDDDSAESGGYGCGIDVTAEVGQTIIVKEVDGNGKPTKWKAVEYQPRTHYSTYEEVQLLDNVTFLASDDAMLDFFLVEGQSYRVIHNGTTYEEVATTADLDGIVFTLIGNPAVAIGDDDGKPYAIVSIEGMLTQYTSMAGTDDTITLYTNQETVHEIPQKYLPDMRPYYVVISPDLDSDGTEMVTMETVESFTAALTTGRAIIAKAFGNDGGVQFIPLFSAQDSNNILLFNTYGASAMLSANDEGGYNVTIKFG